MPAPRHGPPFPRARRPNGRPLLRRSVPLVVALALAGCATASGKHGEGDRSAREAPVTLFVRNYNWSTVHVYVMGGGQTVSLGLLTSMDTATYVIPSSLLASEQSVRLIADPIGSVRAYISEPVFVATGDRIEWTINNVLAQSVISVH